jgi:hypothetical protein
MFRRWSLSLTVLRVGSNRPNQVCYVRLFDLQTKYSKYTLVTWLLPNDDIRICLLDMQISWTKHAIWNLNRKKWRKWWKLVSISLFNNCFGAGHYAYMWSQWAPTFETMFCMFELSIYKLFVLNSSWKLDSQQMVLLLYLCSSWSVVDLQTRFKTWKARNDVNGVYWFHFSYLITVWLTCAHNGHHMSNQVFYALLVDL